MHGAVDFFIEQGSYGLMFAALVAAGMGVPLPEDIVFISGAILAQRGVTDLRLTCVVLAIGVFVGDTVLYTIARRLGPAIYERKFIARVMPPERRKWFEEKIHKHGSIVVFCARHVAGLRGAIFAMTAIHGISYPRFIIADMLALAVSMPIFMLLGWYFSSSIDEALTHAATAEHWVMIGIVVVIALIAVIHGVRTYLKRRDEQRALAAADPVEPRRTGAGAAD